MARIEQRAGGVMLARWVHAGVGVIGVALTSVSVAAAGDPQLGWAGAEQVAPALFRTPEGTVLRVGAKGLVVIDPHQRARGSASTAPAEGLPVRAYVVTSGAAERAGGLPALSQLGAPVLLHRGAMGTGFTSHPTPQLVTFDTDYALRVDEMQAEIEHVGRGRTGTDSVVFFPDLRAVAVGGLFTHGTPEPDCASGGSYAGWAAAISHALWFDFDVAIPEQGAPVGKPALRALRERLQALAVSGAACVNR